LEADYHVLLAATRIVSVSPSRTPYYYRSRLGTVVATSLAGGVLGAQYRYDPYGKLQVALNETAATASEYGYTNALRLTGDLWHLKARVYDAEARVFLQSDSVDRYRYAYVWGDPANLSDPTGLLPVNIVWEGMETSGSLYARLGGILMDGHRDYGYSPKGPTVSAEDAQPPPTPETAAEKASKEDGIGLVKDDEVNTEERSAVHDARRSNLIAAQDAARTNPDFAPTSTATWCNRAVVYQATAVNAPAITLVDMNGVALKANDQADRLRGDTHNGRAPGFWREAAVGEVQTLANDGYLVIPIWKNTASANSHGHEVTVRPENVPGDKIKPGNGPIFNDVGSQRKVTRDAFPVPNEVHYYTPRLP
jgi:RHS repeat-associated protein